MASHELKLLNASVILYILAGALIFHSLGEFEADSPAPRLSSAARRPGPSRSAATDKSGLEEEAAAAAPPPGALVNAGQLAGLRLRSVRRMWNITNQLNILYESNWTQLVLAELVDFERQLIESLEGSQQIEPAEHDGESTHQKGADKEAADATDSNVEDEGEQDDDEKRKNKNKKRTRERTKEFELEQQRTRHEARLRSLKKALVHSLATITAMGSPVEPPRSSLGKLATIFYGALGIPLLVFTLAKSGRALARSSLNLLLALRHYCVALPLHYLCCSCNLFACLRLLSWCCCCCCCSYLCCHSDKQHKQKCCDSSRAPTLSWAPVGNRKSSAGRKRSGADDKRQLEQRELAKLAPTSFVIGFSVPNDSRPTGKQAATADAQKSVRFSAGSRPIGRRPSESALMDDDQPGAGQLNEWEAHEAEEAWHAFCSRDVLLTSVSLLLAYLALGAYYVSRTRDLSLLEALFVCYSMLATTSLPDAFQLDAPKREPLQFYRKLALELGALGVSSNSSSSASRGLQAPTPSGSNESSLIIVTAYLLVGLNLVATCAHFAQLWLAGPSERRLQLAERAANKPVACNGQAPTSALFRPENDPHPHPHPQPPAALAISLGAGLANSGALVHNSSGCDSNTLTRRPPNGAACQQLAAASPLDRLHNSSKQANNLAELFVLAGGGGTGTGSQTGAGHSDGSYAGSEGGHSSNLTQRSLCAHHQSAMALEALASPAGYAQMAPLDQQHQQQMIAGAHRDDELARHLELAEANNNPTEASQLDRMLACRRFPAASIRTSASSIQIHSASSGVAPIINATPGDYLGANELALADYSNGADQNSGATSTSFSGCNSLQHRHHHEPGRTRLNGFANQIRNGGGGGGGELDSSPNTLDTTTTNSHTISSHSSRALTLKQQQQACQPQSGGPKSIWFSDQ